MPAERLRFFDRERIGRLPSSPMPAKRLYIFKTNSPDGYNAMHAKRLCIFDDTTYKPL
jgi:hypothetical protein